MVLALSIRAPHPLLAGRTYVLTRTSIYLTAKRSPGNATQCCTVQEEQRGRKKKDLSFCLLIFYHEINLLIEFSTSSRRSIEPHSYYYYYYIRGVRGVLRRDHCFNCNLKVPYSIFILEWFDSSFIFFRNVYRVGYSTENSVFLEHRDCFIIKYIYTKWILFCIFYYIVIINKS